MSRHRRPSSTVTASAPTRLCLGGEDLDWIGGPALLTAIDLPVKVTFQHKPRSSMLTIHSEGALPAQLTVHQPDWFRPTDSELELVRLCWQHAGSERAGCIALQSSAPRSAGLASSATACVAVLRALSLRSTGKAATAEQLVRAAYYVERDLAGRPVGPMDFVPAAYGGTAVVDSESERITSVTHLKLPNEARFVVVDTRTPRDTGAVIAWKRRRLTELESGIRHYAQEMPTLVRDQMHILQSGGDLDALGGTLDEAQTLLCHQLRVSTPLMDTCIARLRAHGALGAKITGTGLGGCLFALARCQDDATKLAHNLDDLPVMTHVVRAAGSDGFTEMNDPKTLRS